MNTQGDNLFGKGQRIDRYEIRDLIGQGGMGAVYRAIDTKLGRTVALKTVVGHRRGALLSEEMRQRFLREALAASKVDHRNVVQVLDFGIMDDGTPYLVMEYLRGQDLGALLRDARDWLPVEYVVDVMLGVCAALRACHHVGIIHRDLKPANIFLCETDTGFEVKVLDFGVSKLSLDGSITEDGQILGTPQYLSPEQVEGRVVPESDQYALGMLLYACLTRELPYQGLQNLALLRAIAMGEFVPPRARRPDIPEKLEAVILQAMRVAPSERFSSVHALGQHLWEFASPHGREQWRNYYFNAPALPAPRPDEETGEGVPMLQAMAARGLRAHTPGSGGLRSDQWGGSLDGRSMGAARPGATQVLLPSTDLEQVFPPQQNVSTKSGQRTPPGPLTPRRGYASGRDQVMPPVDKFGAASSIYGEVDLRAGRRGRARTTFVVIALLAAGAAGAVFYLRETERPPAHITRVNTVAPAAPSSSAEPAAPATPADPPPERPRVEPPAAERERNREPLDERPEQKSEASAEPIFARPHPKSDDALETLPHSVRAVAPASRHYPVIRKRHPLRHYDTTRIDPNGIAIPAE